MILPVFAISLMGLQLSGHAQTAPSAATTLTPATADFFVGKWKTQIKGVPQGDTLVVFSFDKTDGKLGGSIIDSVAKTNIRFTDVMVKDGTLTARFTTQGYDVNISIMKKDDENFSGSLMDQFDLLGVRIK